MAMQNSASCSTDSACVNVGEQERMLSGIGGGLVGLYGLSNLGSVRGLLSLAIAGGLLYRAKSGHCALYNALGMSTVDDGRERDKMEYSTRDIDESSEESFPASDPPAYTSTAASRNRM